MPPRYPPPTVVVGTPGQSAREIAGQRRSERDDRLRQASQQRDRDYADYLQRWWQWDDADRPRRVAARRRWLTAAGIVAVLTLAAYAAAGVDSPRHPAVPTAGLLLGLVVTLAAVGLAKGHRRRPAPPPPLPDVSELQRRIEQAEIGADTEQRVAAVLAGQVGWYAIAHDADLGVTGDADHVLLGRHIVVIETKTGFGHVRLLPGGRLQAGRRVLPGAPVQQAAAQARALHRRCGQPVRAIVCVADATTPPVETYGGVLVCSLEDLPGCLSWSAGPSNLDRDQSVRLARALVT